MLMNRVKIVAREQDIMRIFPSLFVVSFSIPKARAQSKIIFYYTRCATIGGILDPGMNTVTADSLAIGVCDLLQINARTSIDKCTYMLLLSVADVI